MSVIPANYFDLLQATTVAHVATIGPQGEPQVSPVWFVWDGTALRFSMNKIRQKHRNLIREPRIALSIVDPTNMYRAIEIRGKVRIENDANSHFVNSVVTKKYLGLEYDDEHPNPNLEPGEERIIIVVEPERALTFPAQTDKKS